MEKVFVSLNDVFFQIANTFTAHSTNEEKIKKCNLGNYLTIHRPPSIYSPTHAVSATNSFS